MGDQQVVADKRPAKGAGAGNVAPHFKSGNEPGNSRWARRAAEFRTEFRAELAEAGGRIVDVVHGEHDARAAWGAHRGATVIGGHGGLKESGPRDGLRPRCRRCPCASPP
jgi:hypothetical protein